VKSSARSAAEVPPAVVTNTIKTQTQALYRKLHVSSQQEALAAAGALHLHKVTANPPHDHRMTVVQPLGPSEESDEDRASLEL
jgi:hypothetical protein